MVSLNGTELSLGELIAQNPQYYLGKQTAIRYGTLPFLLKLLAAEKPLSIQAHPNLARAREGFDRENRAGLAPDAPNRNYHDANHKPEIICALTPFTGMCGFRSSAEIRRLLAAFFDLPHPALLQDARALLLGSLDAGNEAAALRNFISALFGLSPAARQELTTYITAGGAATGLCSSEQWDLMRRFAGLYPNDPAILSPLYLNIFHLEPGEAVFLGAGTLHVYIHGLGVELMANSDNVLRGGLTSKYIDIGELLQVLDFSPLRPEILRPPENRVAGRFTYPAFCDEFSLLAIHGSGTDTVFAETGPAVCIVTEGELVIHGGGEDGMILHAGESVFIPDGGRYKEPVLFGGTYTLYAAVIP
jgi:mannose-6-phosphate isomerase